MTTPISSISGLISGIQTADLVNQIIAASSGPLLRTQQQSSLAAQQKSVLDTAKGLLDTLQSAAKTLRDGTAFDAMSAVTAPLAGSKPLVSASAAPEAIPATYQVQVSSLAATQKLGSTAVASPTTALGVTGTISVNGTAITIQATDSLNDIRDAINLANTGTSATKVTATILSVGTSDHRLILQSDTPGTAGATLADTTGTVLQSLGILDTATTIAPAAVLVAGSDAQFTIDGIAFTRTTNTVADAIPGVTLTLTAAEAGATTAVTVSRFTDGATQSAKAFVDAYNAVIDFLQFQGTATTAADGTTTSRPPLFGDALLRSLRSSLPTTLLQSVPGTAVDLSTAGLAGLSLDSVGKLSLDTTKFTAAFTSSLDDLRQLFQQRGTATGTGLRYITSTIDTKAGTFAVDVTALATQATATGTGLAGGPFVDDATPDTLTVTDAVTGLSVDVTLANGATASDIATALQTAFTANGLRLTATAVGGELKLDQLDFGSAASFTVAYTAGGTLSSTLPITAGTYAGMDVTGTINGVAATGSGRSLIGAAGTDVAGLVVEYTGTILGPAGDTTVTLGTGALLERALTDALAVNTGFLAQKQTTLSDRITSLDARAADLQARLDDRRAALLKKFADMEAALARFQAQSSGILALFNNLTQAQ